MKNTQTEVLNFRGIPKPINTKDIPAWEFSFLSSQEQKEFIKTSELPLKEKVLLYRFS